jgi:hypothetical protein
MLEDAFEGCLGAGEAEENLLAVFRGLGRLADAGEAAEDVQGLAAGVRGHARECLLDRRLKMSANTHGARWLGESWPA